MDGQLSIFDFIPNDKPDTNNIIKDILLDVIMTGTVFVGGKKRVYEFYNKDMTAKERANAIKDEYGIGGGSLSGEYFRHGSKNYDAKGIEIIHEEERKLFSWMEIEKIIRGLIDSGKYYQTEKVIGYCHATNDPCNRENLTDIAHDLGMKCEAKCCAGCKERKECGAACNYSRNY